MLGWVSWQDDVNAVPARFHQSLSSWTELMEHLRDRVPTSRSSAGELQRWLLAVALSIRDLFRVNDTENDESEPVAYDGPEYIRRSQADWTHLQSILAPACKMAVYRGPDGEDFGPGVLPRSARRQGATANATGDNAGASLPNPMSVDDVESEGISAGEVENAVMGDDDADLSSTGGQRANRPKSEFSMITADALSPLTSLIRGTIREV